MEHRTVEESVFNPDLHEEVQGSGHWRKVFELDEFSLHALDMRLRRMLFEIQRKGFISFERGKELESQINRVFQNHRLDYRLKYKIQGPRDVRYILCRWKVPSSY